MESSARPAWAPARARRLAVVIGLVAFLIYNANFRTITAGDTYPARFLPLALLHAHTLDLSSLFDAVRMERPFPYWIYPALEHRIASLYPVVTPVLVTPLYIPAWIYLDHHDWGTLRVQRVAELSDKVAASTVAAISCGLLFLLLRRRLAERRALLLTAAYAFATETWAISSQALWQHGVAELLTVLALLLATTSETEPRQTPPATVAVPMVSRRSLLGLGLAVGLLIANRPFDVILAAGFAAGAVATARGSKRLAGTLLAAGASLPLLAAALYNRTMFGNFGGGYQTLMQTGAVLHWNLLAGGAAGLLASPGKGLFVFSPFFVFLLLGFVARFRGRERLAPWLATAVLAQVLLYSAADWRGGNSYGPRFLTDMLPILVWLLAPLVGAISRRGLAAFAALVLCGVFVQVVGVFYYPSAGTDAWMDAWKWRDAPFVNELAAGRSHPRFLDWLREHEQGKSSRH
jgi:hypothetical protein